MTHRILIVDDDRTMVTTLCDIFTLRGWEALPAYSGAEAIRVARERAVPIVLMDIKMQGMSGVEALKALKAEQPGIRVVLMTAYSAESLLAEAEREGVMRVLPKPLDINQLLTILAEKGRSRAPVLIVDHDAGFLRSMSDLLQLGGFETVTAFNINDALKLMRGVPPAAVLLHLQRDFDVAHVVSRVRAVRPDVAIVMYSGQLTALDAARSLLPSDCVQGYFEKPIHVDELTALLHDL